MTSGFADPEKWNQTSIGDISHNIQYGYTESAVDKPVGPKFLRISDIQDGNVDWDSTPHCEISKNEKEKYLLNQGDILFARTGGTVGKSFLIQGDIPESVFASYLIRIQLAEEVNERYVYYFFKSNDYWRQISEGKKGIGQPNVNSTILSEIELPLPSRKEQQRIVGKIEELFSKLDVGTADLQTTQIQLEQYYQSVLKAAMEGKLTEEWREETRCRRNGKDLVEEISQKKQELYTQEKIRKPKTLPDISTDDEPTRLPDGWTWERLGNLFLMINGDRGSNYPSREDRVSEGIPFLSTKNIENNTINIDKSQLKFITEERFDLLRRGKVKDGDVLMALRGSVGKFGVFKKNENFDTGFINAQLIILRPLCGLSPSYFKAVFNSSVFKQQLHRESTGSAQPQISATALSNIILPVPPVEEQIRISSYIEKFLSVTEKLQESLNMELTRAERLRQSILKDAFNGKLVPQDPNAEPPDPHGGDTKLQPGEQATLSEVITDVK